MPRLALGWAPVMRSTARVELDLRAGAPGTALDRAGRCPRRASGGGLGRQAQMPQDARDDGRLVNEGDEPQAPPTARTRQHVEAKRAILILHLPQWN